VTTAPRRLAGRLGRALLLAAIRFYKRHVSPHKGFACAYRVHTGRASCSTLGYRAVARHGVFRGLGILDARLAQCRLKHEKYGPRPMPRTTPRLPPSQAGFLDCGGCDLPGCDLPGCDLPGCDGDLCDCDCDICDGVDIAEGVADCLLPDRCRDDCRPCDRRRRRDPVRERGRRGRAVEPPPDDDAGAAT
jgi:putative component of membrane protein insertase Oxa1/YidC/SpoIIIJ protein YidD